MKRTHRTDTDRPSPGRRRPKGGGRLEDRHLGDAFERLLVAPSAAATAPNFYERVYAVVEQIPRGKVTTYGAIAAVLGARSAARLVGQALTALPECDVPAQRVINRVGALSGAVHFGGYARMRAMLEREGVTFKGELVDMSKHFWDPAASFSEG